jgi:hypothetical protein
MKLVTFEDVKGLGLTALECLDLVSDTIARKRDMVLPPKISLHPDECSFMNTMPCLVTDREGRTWGRLSEN